MNNELTIEECNKSTELYENQLEYHKYLIKVVKNNKKELENVNYIFKTDIKLLKLMQKQGFKLDTNFDKHNNEIQKLININKNIIDTEINIDIEKRISGIKDIEIKIMELSQAIKILEFDK